MRPEILTALIAAIASLVVAIASALFNYITKRRSDAELKRLEHKSDVDLASLNDRLTESRAERDAYRDYIYEARKRLYTELQPLLFQQVELSESAYFRIKGLARYSRQGRLRPDRNSLLREEYYLLSTAYRLVIPVAVFKAVQRRLTGVDLGAEKAIRTQYSLAKALFFTWNGGFRLATAVPQLDYDPYHPEASQQANRNPAAYTRQHIWLGDLERIAEALTLQESSGGLGYMSYGQFEESFRDEASKLHQCALPVVDLLLDFHPQTRPILWRILLTQAHLHWALLQTFIAESNMAISPIDCIDEAHMKEFDWRAISSQVSSHEAVDEPFQAAQNYLRDYLGESLLR